MYMGRGLDAVVKANDWKVEDGRFEPRSGIQVSKKRNVSFLLTRKNSICGEPP